MDNMKYLLSLLLVVPLFAQDVTISQSEMLKIANNIKELQHSDSVKTVQIEMYDRLVTELEDQIKTDSLLLFKKSEQIEILKERDEANKKGIEIVSDNSDEDIVFTIQDTEYLLRKLVSHAGDLKIIQEKSSLVFFVNIPSVEVTKIFFLLLLQLFF